MSADQQAGPGSRSWLLLAVAVGLALGLPSGLLLAFLAIMPAFMGIYFFLLIGLLIGAIMYRLGLAARPVDIRLLRALGLFVAGSIWVVGPAAEYYWARSDAAAAAVKQAPTSNLSPGEIEQLRAAARGSFDERLRRDYWPGGFLGFVRWRALHSTIDLPRPGGNGEFTFKVANHPAIWNFRMLLALLLVSFALMSQFRGLGPEPPRCEEPQCDPLQSADEPKL